jgi:hypothetical protein
MILLRQLKSLFSNPAVAQRQNEALVDLIYLVMFADQSLGLREQEFVQRQLNGIPWTSGITLDFYVQTLIPKIRKALGSPNVLNDLLSSIEARLNTPATRQQAIDTVSLMTKMQGHGESQLITQLRQSWNL